MEEKENTGKNYSIVRWFCGVIVLTLCIYVGYFYYTASVFTKSQEKIVKEHVTHIANVDSLFFEMKKIILDSDTGTIVNAAELLSQLQNDSALFRREILLSQEELNNLAELHLNTIENSNEQINMWFGVVGAIFLMFGFYGIFKIEESKKHAEDLVEEFREKVQQKTDDVLNDIQGKIMPLQNLLNDFTSKNSQFDQLIQNDQAQLDLLNQQYSSSLERVANLEEQLKKSIDEVEKLKSDMESLL